MGEPARMTAGTPRLGQVYLAGVLPPGSVVTAGTGTEYVISRTGLCMAWEQPIPLSGTWRVTYAGRLADGDWMTPRQRAEVDEVRPGQAAAAAVPEQAPQLRRRRLMRLVRDGDIRQFYLTRRAGLTWVPHSHPGWYAVRARLRDRVWEAEFRFRDEKTTPRPAPGGGG